MFLNHRFQLLKCAVFYYFYVWYTGEFFKPLYFKTLIIFYICILKNNSRYGTSLAEKMCTHIIKCFTSLTDLTSLKKIYKIIFGLIFLIFLYFQNSNHKYKLLRQKIKFPIIYLSIFNIITFYWHFVKLHSIVFKAIYDFHNSAKYYLSTFNAIVTHYSRRGIAFTLIF